MELGHRRQDHTRALLTSERQARRRHLASLLAVATGVLTLASVPSVPAFADGSGGGAGYMSLGGGFFEHQGVNGEIDVNVCSFAVPAGTAHCDAHVRTDPWAKQARPARGGGASPGSALGNNGAYDPSYLQSAYNVASAAAAGGGAEQTVAIVDANSDPNVVSDLSSYRSFFGLPNCPTGTISTSNTSCVFDVVNEFGKS